MKVSYVVCLSVNTTRGSNSIWAGRLAAKNVDT